MAEKALDQLETRVTQAVQLLSGLQMEVRTLEEEVQTLKRSLEEVKQDNNLKNQVIKQFRNDRLRIRSRVEQALRKVIALEEPS
ncbi:MAG: cell division protein ZapB [Acidobacteriota bacterium]|nr:cell division protein ZapB [Acidobacteriota bacterium]MCZ6877035.1 cell division protein ZapB [Acidobacteriota bacterium]